MKPDLGPEDEMPCLECDGQGHLEFEVDGDTICPECDGTGVVQL
jgi:DnaJ-class molecular chaperone